MIASVYLYNMIKTLQVGVPGDDALKLHCNPPPPASHVNAPKVAGGDRGCGSERLGPSPWRCFDLDEGWAYFSGERGALRVGALVGRGWDGGCDGIVWLSMAE